MSSAKEAVAGSTRADDMEFLSPPCPRLAGRPLATGHATPQPTPPAQRHTAHHTAHHRHGLTVAKKITAPHFQNNKRRACDSLSHRHPAQLTTAPDDPRATHRRGTMNRRTQQRPGQQPIKEIINISTIYKSTT